MPPVIANGGYYGAPGVTAAGAYGSTPADMLYSLRNNGWSDQQIMDVYGANDPMVRIMQLENRWNQTQPGAGGYRYQYPTRTAAPARRPAAQAQAQRRAAGPNMNTMAETARSVAGMVPGGQQPAAQQPANPDMNTMTGIARGLAGMVPGGQPAAQSAAQPATQQPVQQQAAQPATQAQALGDSLSRGLAGAGATGLYASGMSAPAVVSTLGGLFNSAIGGASDFARRGFDSLVMDPLDTLSDAYGYARRAVPNYFSGLYDTMRRAYYGLF